MKAKLLRTLLPMAILFTLFSCTTDETEDIVTDPTLIADYNYNADEVKLAELINDYRDSIGLNQLETVNHISYKSEEHNEYMIDNNVVNHDYFEQRSQNIRQVLGAVKVNENVAFNFNTPKGVLNAWLASPGHKATIEGDFSRFGISITSNASGQKYYTNIFIK